MKNEPQVTANIETVWQELRQHLDWSEGFSLVFYFSDNHKAMSRLHQRARDYYTGRSVQLHTLEYHPDLEMTKALFSAIQQCNGHEPLWLMLNKDSGDTALQHYSHMLPRLNERRDQLRRDQHQAIIICLPKAFMASCRESAPDLWVIRALSELIENQVAIVEPRAESHDSSSSTVGFPLSEHQQKIVLEWQRLRQQKSDSRGVLLATSRAFSELIKQGQYEDAYLAAQDMLTLSRRRNVVANDSPESLRDVSVSLDNVGKVAQQQGRWGDAQHAYEESLQLSRRLAALLGDSPESLRDLCVSLSKLGDLLRDTKKCEEASSCFNEGLLLAQRLATLLPDIPSYSELPEHFEKAISTLP